MKKILIILICIFTILFLRSTVVYIVTENLIKNYEGGSYDDSSLGLLYALDIYSSYIDYYNHGNIYYKQKDYKNAKERYEKALKKNPPKSKVCDIRVNLALSILGLMESDNNESHLNEALEVLYQDDCAHKEDDKGRSAKAEELEEQIKKNDPNDSGGDGDENKGDDSDGDDESGATTEAQKEEQLKKELYENTQERGDELQSQENYNSYSYYEGARW